MSMLLVQGAIFLLALLLTGILKNLAPDIRFLDRPVARSAHSVPTPVGGGLIIAVLFLLGSGYLYGSDRLPPWEFLALLGVLPIVLIGLLDDLGSLAIRPRVSIQFLAAIWTVWCLGRVPPIDFGIFVLESGLVLDVLAVLALVWLLNLYNFMDGIDGLAAVEVLFVNVMSLFLVINSTDLVVGLLSATLASAVAGFLVWNWPPARIFMGDAGSGFIGFTLGALALISMHHGSMSVWSWVILLAVFIVDASVTLFRRALSGEKWYEGHASHAYQNAARRYKSHAKVTITVVAINCLWLAPLAWLSAQRPQLGLILAIIAMTPLCFLAIRLKAGKLIGVSLSGQSQC